MFSMLKKPSENSKPRFLKSGEDRSEIYSIKMTVENFNSVMIESKQLDRLMGIGKVLKELLLFLLWENKG